MFSKKKIPQPQIDKEQLELIQNAQKRIKQKKRLYIHFVVFLIGALFLTLANLVLGIGETYKPFQLDWFVIAILIWLFILAYHTFNVFVTHKFMGKNWEKQQLSKLVSKQEVRIEKLKNKFEKEEMHIAKSEVYNTEITKKESNLTIIVATAENEAIGKNNKLIWHLSDDLKRFKDLTNGHHIIMGRKTFESFPKPLPNRTHIVITRQQNYTAPQGVVIVNTLDEAILAVKNDRQPFIIGGGEIYKQAMDLAETIELTRVHETFEADTFFPKIDTSIWKEINNKLQEKNKTHQHAFSFITYKRR